MTIHDPFPGQFGQLFNIIARIAVPIFFMITGYYFEYMECNNKLLKYCRNLLQEIIFINVFYMIFNLMIGYIHGQNIIQYFDKCFSIKNILQFIFVNSSLFSIHLWYLNALLYSIGLIFILRKVNLFKLYIYLVPLILFCNVIVPNIYGILYQEPYPETLTRNFIFVGMPPYISIGIIISKIENIKIDLLIKFTIFAIFLSFLEIYFVRMKSSYMIRTIPLAISIFLLFLNNPKRSNFNLLNMFANIGRLYSKNIYLYHYFFINCASLFLSRSGSNILKYTYLNIGCVIIYVTCIIFQN